MKNELKLVRDNWIEYASLVIFALGSGVILLLQLYFKEVFHYTILQASFILGAAGGGQLFGSFFTNSYVKIMRQIVRRGGYESISAIRLGLFSLSVMTAILFALFAINSYYPFFILMSFLLGVFLSLFYPIVQAVLFENLSISQTVLASSLRRWAVNVGVGISLTLISFATHHPKILFLTLAVLIAIAAFFFCFRLRTKTIFDNENKTVKANNAFQLNFSRKIIAWGIGIFLGTAIFFQTISVYPIFLHDHYGMGSSLFSRLMLINVFMVLIFQFIAPYFEKRLSIHTLSALGMLIMGIGIGLVLVHSFNIVILSFILWSIGEIFYMGMVPVYSKIFAAGDEQSSLQYSSYYYFLFYLGKMVGPIVGSFAYAQLEDKSLALVGIIILACVGTVPFIYLRNKRL